MFCFYTAVLGPELNAAVYQLAMERRALFEQSRAGGRVDLKSRTSLVVYDQHLTSVRTQLEMAVRDRLREALPRLGIPPFAIGDIEIQMTSHNDGEFFKRHTDSASADTASRTLTFVYYFHGDPKGYTGGELVFFDQDGREDTLDPSNDSMVLFDPRSPHEVRPVSCPSGRFEDGRFTLNGWVHRRRTRPSPDTFFDR